MIRYWRELSSRKSHSRTDRPAKGPNAATFEIASRLHCEAIGITRLDRTKSYSQRVRQPAAGPQADQFADAMFLACF
jgi:hypothetical protein